MLSGPKFRNKDLSVEFERKGYLKLASFMDAGQLMALNKFYETVAKAHQKIDLAFVSTSHSNDKNLIRQVNDQILSIVTPSIKRWFEDYEILFSNFLLKKARKDSITDLHEDVTLVDEQKYLSFNLWFPLHRVDKQNGTMCFVSGSHLYPRYIRTNPYNLSPYREHFKLFNLYADTVNCEAGDAVVFANNTIHGSYANHSSEDRVAGVIAMYPQGADLFHYHLSEQEKKIDCYRMTVEDFINLDKRRPPDKAPCIGSTKWKDKRYTEKEILHLLGKNYGSYLIKKWLKI